MKTSKNQIAEKVQRNLTTKSGSIRSCWMRTVNFLNSESVKYPIHYWTGSRNHMRLVETNIEQGLSILGIDYKVINDAPRGGKEGDKIELTKKGIAQVKRYRDYVKKQNEVMKAKDDETLAAIEAEKQAKIKGLIESGNVLAAFFANETHPAPAEVVAMKEVSGLSWRELRRQYR